MHGSTASAATAQLAAVASIAVRPLLMLPVRAGTMLGVSEHVIWIGTEDDVVVLSDRAAIRLPNAVEVAHSQIGRWIDSRDAVSVGGGIVRAGHLTAVTRRWFDPRPTLARCEKRALETHLDRVGGMIERMDDHGLGAALASGDGRAVLDRARMLIGLGAGLTPAGDDLLAGALASHLLLGEAADHPPAVIGQLIQPIDALSRTRTTGFSGALLRHAVRGRVALPVADVLHAMTGRGDIHSAVERLLAVGHSSGPALVAGILIGASALTLENAS